MELFTGTATTHYPRGQMKVKTQGTGPWGDAIKYWLKLRGWVQADLVAAVKALEATADKPKGSKNTVSRAFRGLDVNTSSLVLIAKALDVDIEDVLISPLRQLANDERRKEIQVISESVTENIWRRMTAPSRTAPSAAPVPSTHVIAPKILDAALKRVEQRAAKKPAQDTTRQKRTPSGTRRRKV